METVLFVLGSLAFLGAIKVCLVRVFAAGERGAGREEERRRQPVKPAAEEKYRQAA